jgi:type I restriction-modification system DNA methylase subunit
MHLITALIFSDKKNKLAKPDIVKLLYDPACRTDNMLTIAKNYIQNNIFISSFLKIK